MTEYKMMDEVIGYCTKCKLELNQRIIRVEAGRPKRALCLTCNTERSYRKSAPAKAGEGKVRSQRTSSSQRDQEAEWRAKLGRQNKTPKAYAMDKTYLLDDHIEHRLFGVGLVVSLVHPGKINVFFQDGLKTMKCGLI
ncbi:MAG: hypothetical protein HYT77_02805 [Deltaproteobacteria bacterium]|nr:hypothetical protein [Deltaproteobacteria bacterium]